MDLRLTRERMEELHESAFGWALCCCGRDHDLASDVLQISYLRILSGQATFRERSALLTFVFGVIRRVASEELRRGRDRLELRSLTHDQVAPNPTARLEARELRAQLLEGLSRLSSRQREVLHLVFYEGLTIELAAETLSIAVGSARQHYERGKRALRQFLEPSSHGAPSAKHTGGSR